MKPLIQAALKVQDRKAIEAAADLLRRDFPVEHIILYGSKATGADDAESDIDLLVLTARPLGWKERNAITDALFDLELEYGVVISTLVVPTREWNEGRYAILPIRDEVDRYGVAA